MNHKGIENLIHEISKKISKLKNGELNTNELEVLTSKSRELYEILTIMRYVIKDKKQQKKIIENKQKNLNTTDLIFDFSNNESSEKKLNILNEIEENSENSEVKNTEIGSKTQDETQDESSINNDYKGNDEASFVNKMRKQPIDNLIKHISINQRFIFVLKLFNNNNEQYIESINYLEKLTDIESAKNYFNELTNKFNWNNNDIYVKELYNLIIRRFLN